MELVLRAAFLFLFLWVVMRVMGRRELAELSAFELVLVVGAWTQAPAAIAGAGAPLAEGVSNTHALGLVLYTKYVYFFQAAGLILLTAMIGAIVLTLRHKPDVKRQVIADQNARDKSDVQLKKVPSRAGV